MNKLSHFSVEELNKLRAVYRLDYCNNISLNDDWDVTGLISSVTYNQTYLGEKCIRIHTGIPSPSVYWTVPYKLDQTKKYIVRMKFAVRDWTGDTNGCQVIVGMRYPTDLNKMYIKKSIYNEWIDYEQEVIPTSNELIIGINNNSSEANTFLYITDMEICTT